MYKVTIEEVVGEIRKITTLETDDVELVKAVLTKNALVKVESDKANLNIDKDWQELLDWYKKKHEQEKDKPYKPFIRPLEPWEMQVSPFTITC